MRFFRFLLKIWSSLTQKPWGFVCMCVCVRVCGARTVSLCFRGKKRKRECLTFKTENVTILLHREVLIQKQNSRGPYLAYSVPHSEQTKDNPWIKQKIIQEEALCGGRGMGRGETTAEEHLRRWSSWKGRMWKWSNFLPIKGWGPLFMSHTSSLHACSLLVWCTQRLPRAFIVLQNVSLSAQRTLVLH